MFDEQAFHSWPYVIVGALCFSALFALVAAMAELLFEGTFRLTRSVVGFAIGAFVGYIGVAMLIRHSDSSAGKA